MIKLIAHRGKYNNIITENTYLSIKQALNDQKYIGVEFDIHLTKDLRLVVIHDLVINRTSNGNGLVANMTLKELKKYNFGSNNIIQTIPTLEQILDIDSNKIFLIELKCDHNEKKMAKELLKVLTKYPHKKIWLCSFNKKVLRLLKGYKLGLIKLIKLTSKVKYDLSLVYKYGISSKKINKITKDKTLLLWTINGKEELNNIKKDIISDDIIFIYHE